jgi:hypothetical protein
VEDLSNAMEILNPEPDQHYYRVGKTHRNAGPYVWSNKTYVDDPNGNRMIGYVYSADTDLDSTRVTNQVIEISRYVTSSLKELGQDNCPTESLINVYFVPKDTINDPKKMAFLTNPDMTNHKTLFGLTTVAMPFPISSSYICSDCEEYRQEALITHELSHAWLSLCGDRELALTEDVPEMLEANYLLRLSGEDKTKNATTDTL